MESDGYHIDTLRDDIREAKEERNRLSNEMDNILR